jgi:diacylglycerol kinase family enzyme
MSNSKNNDMRHLFVVNPKSFVTLKDLKNFLLDVEMCFSIGHRAEYKIYISRYPRDAYSAVHRYLSNNPDDETVRVYAVGGDGIAFDCLNGLANFPNAELAPIPYGNANDIVRGFGDENTRFFRDIKLMSKSPSRPVDMMKCNGHYALGNCSIGVEAIACRVFGDAIDKINTGKMRKYVPLLYKLGAVKALIDGSAKGIDYRLTLDGVDFSDRYMMISIGNMPHNGGTNTPNPLARPDDGELEAVTLHVCSAARTLRVIPAYTSGQFVRFPKLFEHRSFREMRCESDSLMIVILDGEIFYTREIELKIIPNGTKIVSPNGIGFADYAYLAIVSTKL